MADWQWQAGPGKWGAEDGSSVVFGSAVVDDLVTGMQAYLGGSDPSPRRSPAALGCVGWLTDFAVVRTLLRFGTCCIVVDKPGGRSAAERRLLSDGGGFSAKAFPALAEHQRGQRVIGPGSAWGDVGLEPLRVAGWHREDGGPRPHLHAKLLVLGQLHWSDEDPLGGVADVLTFRPERLWTGSANWTRNARDGVEMGMWVQDAALMRHATDFLVDVLAFSEPLGSTSARPQPELVPVEYDDEALAAYLAEAAAADEAAEGHTDPV